MWPHFLNLVRLDWNNLVKAAGTTTFGIVLFSVAVPLVTSAITGLLLFLLTLRSKMNSISGFVAGNPLLRTPGCLPFHFGDSRSLFLGNTSCSVRDPELDQSSHARDREQSSGRK
jgi:hypothetical protein